MFKTVKIAVSICMLSSVLLVGCKEKPKSEPSGPESTELEANAGKAVLTVSGGGNFAPTTVGSTSPVVTYTYTNTGRANAKITSKSFSTGTQYSLSGGTCVNGVNIAPGAFCTYGVVFQPAAAGVITDSYHVVYDNGRGSAVVSTGLSATGVPVVTPAVLNISTASAAYNDTTVAGTSNSVSFTVTNTGGSAATLSTIAFGTNQYTVTGGTCAVNGVVAATNGTCTLITSFKPTSAGVKTDSLSVGYNDGSTLQSSSRSVTATALTPASLSIAVTSFGNVQTGTTSSKTFIVTNSGQSSATISSRTLVTADQYAITGGTCAPLANVSASGGTCTLIVAFSPTTSGTKTDTIELTYINGATTVMASAAITGSGLGAAVLSIGGVTFPTTTVGNTSTSVTATVTNTGGSTATVFSRSLITGTQFTITGGTCVANTFIGVGGTCTVVMVFNPTGAAGTKSDTLNVSYNDGWSTRTASLGISGIAEAVVTPAVLSFGAVSFPSTQIGSTSAPVTATLSNTGGSSATILSRSLLTGTNFSITGGTCTTSATVAVNGSCTVVMTFSPTGTAGTKSDTLNVSYNDGAASQTASLGISGVAEAAVTPAVLSFSAVSFPSTQIGSTSAPVTATLSNTGGSTATILGRTLLTATDFAITGGTCTTSATVAVNASCTVVMTFSPTGTAGTKSDTLNVSYNDGVTSQMVSLAISGTATAQPSGGALTSVWANDGGDKIAREERRGSVSSSAVINSVWDGTKIKLFGAKNEVLGFDLILETGVNAVSNVAVSFNLLTGPAGATISSSSTSGDGVYNWTSRNIELFYVRYLKIKGLSKLSYETYDERHVPKRMRRPWSGSGIGSGGWTDRPDAGKFYPEIAVPLELVPTFTIAANQNQSVWADIYVPKTATSGIYSGTISISENGTVTRTIPVELTVRNFALPDSPSSKTMIFVGYNNVAKRYTGVSYPNSGSTQATTTKLVRDRHFLMAHRHKISVIDGNSGPEVWSSDAPRNEWLPRLNGNLFTGANGYDGPGVSTPNDIFSIGTYGSWNWQSGGQTAMNTKTDAWESWFQNNSPATERFLYLIDESSNYTQTEQWASWVKNNPGVGKNLKTFATTPLPTALANMPSLSIPASWFTVGITSVWQNASDTISADSTKSFYAYNGKRPSNGSFATEDDGVALRELAWAQYKKKVKRWFFWESTYYNDYQGGRGETNVFQTACTFGGTPTPSTVTGETGWNYSNGDGVLFYPGTDTVYPAESYGVQGPIASLRLKHWRRGIQDVDYITLASAKNPTATQNIVNQMVPKAMWDYGVNDVNDPTWVRTDISWSINPDDWESARSQLADIIEAP